MTNRTKTIAAAVAIVTALYLIVLPLFRPKPSVSAVLPSAVRTSDVVPIEVTVSGWQRSIDIANVRFYVDYINSTAMGPKGIFFPVILYDRTPRRFGRLDITWPYERKEQLTLALAPIAEEGMLGPGVLTGKIDVTVSYLPGRRGRSFLRDRSRRETMSVPFTINVTE